MWNSLSFRLAATLIVCRTMGRIKREKLKYRPWRPELRGKKKNLHISSHWQKESQYAFWKRRERKIARGGGGGGGVGSHDLVPRLWCSSRWKGKGEES